MVHVISDRGYYIIKPVQFFNFLGELSLVQNQKTEILNSNLNFRYPSTYPTYELLHHYYEHPIASDESHCGQCFQAK